MKRISIPSDYEVQPLKPGQSAKARCTCGTCGLSWDDGVATGITPTPSGRCPFESFHIYAEDEEQAASRRHTPGPWEVCHGQMCTVWIKSRHSLIASIPTDSVYCAAEVEQNARLLAAAPALMSALDSLLNGSFDTPKEAFIAYNQAREVLAQAKGEQA